MAALARKRSFKFRRLIEIHLRPVQHEGGNAGQITDLADALTINVLLGLERGT